MQQKEPRKKWQAIRERLLFISPLSTHILFYARKLTVPDQEVSEMQAQLGIVPLTKEILDKALQGPTPDLEDNIQLHSAAEAECDIFLTEDKKLLNMKFLVRLRLQALLSNQLKIQLVWQGSLGGW